MSSEFDRIALLERIFQHPATSTRGSLQPDNPVQLGIGDDAAVLVPPTDGTAFVWTVDAAVEGVHFRRDWLSLEDIGYRSVIAAASDVLAMGGTPLWLLSALTFPEQFSDTDLAALATGQQGAADCLNATMVGGNLARSGILSMTTTVLGKAAHPITRRGAKPGDALWLIGEVGLAGAGLEYLRRGARDSSASARHCVAQWQRPSCYVNAPKLWRDAPPHAAIDLSDGLVADLMHLLRASAVDANVEVEALLSPTLRDAAEELSVNALRFALTGGEDYALLVAAPNDWAAPADWAAASARDGNLRAKRIGTVSARDPALRLERGRAEPKLLLRKANGDLQEAADLLLELGLSSGFDHFR